MKDKEFNAKCEELLTYLENKELEDKELVEEMLKLIKNKGNDPSKESHKKATPSKKFILIYSIVSLLIFLFFTVIAVTEKDSAVIFFAVPFIAIQWGIYYLIKPIIKWSIRYLKRKSPAAWRAVLSVWIACAVFLMLSLLCLSATEDEDISAPLFIIGSLSIAAVLTTVLFSIKKMKGSE